MTPPDLAGIMKRAREWGEATPSPDAVVWTRDQLAEAYLLAGMDRRALLGLLRETREALDGLLDAPRSGRANARAIQALQALSSLRSRP